jgi:PHD/YefM family antitoxin component YafN of YafNO toxin-antitoxin module
MQIITDKEANQGLSAWIRQVIERHEPLCIDMPPTGRAVLLAEEDYRRLMKTLELLNQPKLEKTRRSIMELRGMGKEIWKDVNAGEYVNQERDAWNG